MIDDAVTGKDTRPMSGRVIDHMEEVCSSQKQSWTQRQAVSRRY